MSAGKVLIVDNNLAMVGEIKSQIDQLGLEVLWADGGREAIKLFVHNMPDAVILREALPDIGGWEAAELIRTISDAPIIFVTNQPNRLSRNRALQLGDEYMTPPWRWDWLRARLTALLKRSSVRDGVLPDPYDDGYLHVDIRAQTVKKAGRQVRLTKTEYKLLSCFMRHPDRALSHNDILQSVWGHSYINAKADVTLCVSHLRHKIEADPSRPSYLQTVRGIGYLFSPHRSPVA